MSCRMTWPLLRVSMTRVLPRNCGVSKTNSEVAAPKYSSVARHPNPPPGCFWHRQAGMRGLHAREALDDLAREGGSLLRCHVDVQHHVLGAGREPAFLGVVEPLEIMQPLGVEIEQLES